MTGNVRLIHPTPRWLSVVLGAAVFCAVAAGLGLVVAIAIGGVG